MLKPAYSLSLSVYRSLFRAFSALKTEWTADPGALPQAVRFRAFGAEGWSFHTVSIATGLTAQLCFMIRSLPLPVLTRLLRGDFS